MYNVFVLSGFLPDPTFEHKLRSSPSPFAPPLPLSITFQGTIICISVFQIIALNIFYKQHIKTYVLSKTLKISPTIIYVTKIVYEPVLCVHRIAKLLLWRHLTGWASSNRGVI